MSTESLRARLDAATPGSRATAIGTDGYYVQVPLTTDSNYGIDVGLFAKKADAVLDAHAPTDLAAALEVIERANDERRLRFGRLISSQTEIAYTQAVDRLHDALDAFEALP